MQAKPTDNHPVRLAVRRPMQAVELMLALEEVFDIAIPHEVTEPLRTVQDAVDFVRGQVAA